MCEHEQFCNNQLKSIEKTIDCSSHKSKLEKVQIPDTTVIFLNCQMVILCKFNIEKIKMLLICLLQPKWYITFYK